MPWSGPFVDQLATPRIRPRWVVEPIESVGFEPVPGSLKLSSHNEAGYNGVLSATGNHYTAGRLEIGTWTQTQSEMTLGIVPAIDIRPLIARGQLVQVRMGFAGWDISDYQVIFVGHVQSIDRSGDVWSLTIRSIVASLISRMIGDATIPALFSPIASSAVDVVDYDVTAGVPDATLNVTSATFAEAETGGNYLLWVEPSGGEDPFFLRATALVADAFTIDANTPLGTIDGTTVTAPIGSVVTFVPYVEDSPVPAIAKILASTGAGTNGAFDTLPDTWGIGIPQSLIDEDDINLTQDIVDPAGAGMTWDVYSLEEQLDALSWIQGVLAPAGIVVCERQGLVTIRAASPSYEHPYAVATTISDDDLISVDRAEAWSSEAPFELQALLVTAAGSLVAGSNETEDLTSRPAVYFAADTLDYVSDNQTDWEESVLDRTATWRLRLPETLEITCRGLRLAALTLCDTVVIDSRHVESRDHAELPEYMITSCAPDWWGGTVRLTLARIPDAESEY